MIKAGYKQTEVGVIPKDWEVKQLRELIHNVEYGSSAKSLNIGSIPVLRMGNLQNGKINWDNLVFTNSKSEIKKYILNHNDVLFNRTNTIDLVGKTSIYKSEFPAIFAGYLIRINRKKDLLIADYLNYVLNTYWSKKYSLLVLSVAVGQANINGKKLKTYPIPLPPTLKEQKAIAQALSDIDQLIASLNKLTAKKRAIKTATMQQLLTGKTRLSGFGKGKGMKQSELGEIPEDWEILKFEDVLTGFSSGATPSRSHPEYFKGNIPWITSGELNYNYIDNTIESVSKNAVKATNLAIHPIGTFLMAITGLEAAGTRGSCAITAIEATTNQSCMALLPKSDVSIQYFFYYYQKNGENLAFEYCQGTKQQSYTGAIVKILPILLPNNIKEQEAIACIFSDMDAEISTLETKLQKTKAIKQGMMQELLTGKTRLEY